MPDDRFLENFDRFVKWNARLAKEGPFVERFLKEAGARAVLDAGAGSGRHAAWLAARGFAVTAADAARCMVEETRRYAESTGVKVTAVQCGFAEVTGYLDAPVDAVICLGNSLCMLPDVEAARRAVAAFGAALRPGGVLILHALNYRGLRLQNKRVSRPTALEEGGLLLKIFDLEPDATRVNFVRMTQDKPGQWKAEHSFAPLLPLDRETLQVLLAEAAFEGVEAFGSAGGEPYKPDASYDLFLKASKTRSL